MTITWYPGKQNSLILHGKLSTNLSNILLKACQKKTDISFVEINASPKSAKIDNLASIPGYKYAPKPISVTDKSESESACLRSLCNLQCDCKCSLLAAELEGAKLDMVIMQRNIESNTVSANITRAEEVERLKQTLANEREKNRQLEEDISVLVSGRNSEIAELNDIINSLQNKLESKGLEAIHNTLLVQQIKHEIITISET